MKKWILYIFLFPFIIIKYMFIGIYKLIVYLINLNKSNSIKKMIDSKILPSLERDAKIRKQTSRNLVQVTSHGESCQLCKKWENKILNDDVFVFGKINYKYGLLSNAIKQGLFHDGCRHGLTTYFPEIRNISYNESKQSILMVDEETGEVVGKFER